MAAFKFYDPAYGSHSMELILPMVLGFLFTWGCFFCGVMVSRSWKRLPISLVQGGNGFSGGLLLAVSCLAILPDAFGDGFTLAVAAMLAGVFLTVHLEKRAFLPASLPASLSIGNKRYFFILKKESFSIWLTGIPGIFLFGLLYTKPILPFLCFLPISVIHLASLGISLGVLQKKKAGCILQHAVKTAAASLPYSIFAGIGSFLGNGNGVFTKMAIGIFGGSLLYVVCGQILPEGLSVRAGRITAFGGVFGFLFGVLLVCCR